MTQEQETPVGGGQQEIRPGPIRGRQAPAPGEIVCVAVDKVFDFCFDETSPTRTVPLPGVPMDAAVNVTLNAAGASHQVVAGPSAAEGGLCDVTLAVTVPAVVKVGGQPAINVNFMVFREVRLCMPGGTAVDCHVTGSAFGALVDVDGDGLAEELFAQANLILVMETTARVKILVPSYGFCTPGPSRVPGSAGPPEFPDPC